MVAINYSTMRNNLKRYCDIATDDDETVIVTRKDEKNVVLMSLEQYNHITKALRNMEYLAAIDRGLAQVEQGTCRQHDLIEVDDNG